MVLISLGFLAIGEVWPPKSEAGRLALYEQNALLFEGKHDRVFTGLNPLDDPKVVPMSINWHKRLTTLFADLLVGEAPRISAAEKDAAARIVQDNSLSSIAYDIVMDVIKNGTGLFKIRFDQRGIIERQNPAFWYPVVNPDNSAEITAHVLAWTFDAGFVDHVKTVYLRAEIHTKGKIENRLYVLRDGKIFSQVGLKAVDRYAALSESVNTGVNDFLVVPVQNTLGSDGIYGLDDYSGINDLVRELEKRIIKLSKILDIHSKPTMAGPDDATTIDNDTGQTGFPAGGYITLRDGENPPVYVTWDAKAEAIFSEVELILRQLYVISETGPACFGELKQGLAESGSALKRLLLPTLARVNRLRLKMDPALKKVLTITADLEVANRGQGAQKLTNLRIKWADGLPIDATEAANVEKTRKDAGLTSTRASLSRLDEDASEEDLDKEVQAIQDEKASAPPVVVPA